MLLGRSERQVQVRRAAEADIHAPHKRPQPEQAVAGSGKTIPRPDLLSYGIEDRDLSRRHSGLRPRVAVVEQELMGPLECAQIIVFLPDEIGRSAEHLEIIGAQRAFAIRKRRRLESIGPISSDKTVAATSEVAAGVLELILPSALAGNPHIFCSPLCREHIKIEAASAVSLPPTAGSLHGKIGVPTCQMRTGGRIVGGGGDQSVDAHLW